MSSQWHYSKDGSQHGPVTSQRLRELAASGELEPNDLIWKEGLADWRPAMSLKGLFPEHAKPSGPPPLPTEKPDAHSVIPSAIGLHSSPDVPSPTVGATDSPVQRKPDFFDRARDLTQKAKAKAEAFQKEAKVKAEAFQKEAQARADRVQKEAQTNPSTTQAAMMRGAKAAVDYARSDEVKELARKARDTVKGGAIAATALAGAASAEGRDRVRKASEQPLVVGAALLCFFPLGLFLVWHHPHWTPTRKLAWTGAWLGIFFLMMVPALVVPRGILGGVPASNLPTVGDDPIDGQPSDRSKAVSGVPDRSRDHFPDGPQTDSKLHWLSDVKTPPPYVDQAKSEGKGVWQIAGLNWKSPSRSTGDDILYLIEERVGYTVIEVSRHLAMVDDVVRENALVWSYFPRELHFFAKTVADDGDRADLELVLEFVLHDEVRSGTWTKISIDKRRSRWTADSRRVKPGELPTTERRAGRATYLNSVQ